MAAGLKLSLADGHRWLICPLDDKAALTVAELGRVMRLNKGKEGRELYVAVSDSATARSRPAAGAGGPLVCCIPEPCDPDTQAVGMYRIAETIVGASFAAGGLLLHAALAELGGAGFAMAGPSGAGKSTASDRLPPPWSPLCDDSTLVLRDGAGRWWAHPWPTWSRFFPAGSGGSWPVERATPLGAIFFLAKASSDRLAPVNTSQATAFVMVSAVHITHETYRLPDEQAARELSSDAVRAARSLAAKVPAYRLEVSLQGSFWEEIRRVLPPGVPARNAAPSTGGEPAAVDDLIATDSRRLVYTGASMNPTFVEPELLQVEPYRTGRVRRGDVVCFRSPDDRITIVHRVVSVSRRPGLTNIRTRGDNNPGNDQRLLSAADIIGQVTVAWRGGRRRSVAGGWRALAGLAGSRAAGRVRRRLGIIPHLVYAAAAWLGPFDCLLPAKRRARLVRFDAQHRTFLKLLSGRRVVGQYDELRRRWQVRRPFRLFVPDRTLERAAADVFRP